MKAVTLIEAVPYDKDGVTYWADKGEEIEITSDEFDRLSQLDPPAVAKPQSKDAKAAKLDEAPEPAES